MRSSQNALVHGGRSNAAMEEARRVNALLRECREFLRSVAHG